LLLRPVFSGFGIAVKLTFAGLKRPIAILPKDCLFFESRLFSVDIVGAPNKLQPIPTITFDFWLVEY
jgi:hypothetical protein